jgi:hypothetical protein
VDRRLTEIAATSGQERIAWEYRGPEASLSIRSAHKRVAYYTEASMIDFKRLGLAAILSAAMVSPVLAEAMVQEPGAYASNETATRPWSAPVGHRQPRAADIPASLSGSQQIIDREDANVDMKIKGVCRGC